MTTGKTWASGDQIVLRYRNRTDPRILWAEPVIVVEDSPTCIALYLPIDTPIKRPVDPDGNLITRSLSYDAQTAIPWRLGDARWRDTSVLWLNRPGAAHAVGVFWRGADHAFLGWYVDLQEPLTRTSAGFDTVDHLLDVVVAPDLSWHWKDEDEFAAAQRLGHFAPARAAAIRAEGESVIASITARAWPFDAEWEHWQPDPSWAVPRFAPGWDED